MIAVKFEGKDAFDSVIVVTDRRILDDQSQKTIKQFMQVGATVGAVTGDATSKTEKLRKFIADGMLRDANRTGPTAQREG